MSRKLKGFRVGDLFHIRPTKNYGLTNIKLFKTKGNVPVVVNSSLNNGIGGYVDLQPLEKGNMITFSDTTTSESIFYQPNDFIGYSHVQGLHPKGESSWTKNSYLYFKTAFFVAVKKKYNYGAKFNRTKAAEEIVYLPITSKDSVDYTYMEEYISELEAKYISELEAKRISKLKAYLKLAGLNDYILTTEEQNAIELLNNDGVQWGVYNVEKLFGESKRGKRLKSADRISGNLPFVTAGETDEGISAYIGNNVDVFPKNTSTIDMFGSAKYRNYDYGADDHIAVVYTENLSKFAAMFVTSALHKAAHSGQFDYSNNFYAKDADALSISLPTKNMQPDFNFMDTYIKATQKLVIENLV